MFKFEKKAIEFLNRYMVHIALVFVIFAAGYMRLAGRNYVGNDFHFALYDIPGNCGSFIYRMVTLFLNSYGDLAVDVLKIIAYVGDFSIAFLALILLHEQGGGIVEMRTFLIATACLLSPVSLMYSIGSMEIDSVCMSLLLVGVLLWHKGKICVALLPMIAAAYILPTYWPVVFVLFVVIQVQYYRERGMDAGFVISGITLILGVVISVFLENVQLSAGYFWGKVFVINPNTAEPYTSLGLWLADMFEIYGYFMATTLLLLALKYKKWRVPALIMQVFVIMYAGWRMTSYLAL